MVCFPAVPSFCVQDEVLGAVARLPELQFLDKNSKFKAGGRTYKAFRLMARAVAVDPRTGRSSVLAQVESDTFKVGVFTHITEPALDDTTTDSLS